MRANSSAASGSERRTKPLARRKNSSAETSVSSGVSTVSAAIAATSRSDRPSRQRRNIS
jgi:hypothetical protein